MVGRETSRQLVAKCLALGGQETPGKQPGAKGSPVESKLERMNAQRGDSISELCLCNYSEESCRREKESDWGEEGYTKGE